MRVPKTLRACVWISCIDIGRRAPGYSSTMVVGYNDTHGTIQKYLTQYLFSCSHSMHNLSNFCGYSGISGCLGRVQRTKSTGRALLCDIDGNFCIPVYTIDSIDRIDTRVLMLNRLLSITRLYRDIEKYYRYACIDIDTVCSIMMGLYRMDDKLDIDEIKPC